MLLVKKLLVKILTAMDQKKIENFSYSSTTSWKNVGTISLPKDGLYCVAAIYSNTSVLGLGLSSTSSSSPTMILSESMTGGSRYGTEWLPAGSYAVWTKCSAASKTNWIEVRPISCP